MTIDAMLRMMMRRQKKEQQMSPQEVATQRHPYDAWWSRRKRQKETLCSIRRESEVECRRAPSRGLRREAFSLVGPRGVSTGEHFLLRQLLLLLQPQKQHCVECFEAG